MGVPASYQILDTFLDAYTGAIDSGFGTINGSVQGILSILAVISLATAAVFWMLDETDNVMAPLVRQIMKIGLFVWIVNDWQGLTQTVITGFAETGLRAGGSGVGSGTFLNNPGNIVVGGFRHAMNAFNLMEELTGPVDFFINLPSIIVLAISALGVIIAFFIIAVQLVVTLIEFRLVTLAAFILVPFGVLNKTSFLAERSFGYVVSAGLKVLTISLVVTIGGSTFDNIALVTMGDANSMFVQAMSVMLAALLLMMLSLTIPATAAALVTGGPQLGAGAALAGAAGMAAGVGGSYLAARGAAALPGAVASAPGAIAAKAKAAASGTLGKGFDQMASGAAPKMGAAPSASSGSSAAASAAPASKAGSGSAPNMGSSSGSASPVGGSSGTAQSAAPTEKMQDYAASVAEQQGIDPPDMSDGNAVRDFLNANSGQELGAYRPDAPQPVATGGQSTSAAMNASGSGPSVGAGTAAPSRSGAAQPSPATTTSAATAPASASGSASSPSPSTASDASGSASAPVATGGNDATATGVENSAAASAAPVSQSAPTPAPASTNAPPVETTVARLSARRQGQAQSSRAAQTAAAASNSQGGAGISATNIENEE